MAEENDESSAPAKKKSKLPLIIIAVVLLLVLGGGGFVAMTMMSAPAEGTEAASEEVMGEDEGAPGVSAEPGMMVPFDVFIVNLSNAGGKRYLKIAITAEVPAGKEDLATEISSKMPVIKDTLISVLSSKALEEISTQQGKVSLKQELLRRINSVLAGGKVKDLYFTDFVIQ